MEAADRDDRRFGWRDLARHDRLQPHDRHRGHHDRIHRRLRAGAVPATPMQRHAQGVPSREHGAAARADRASGKRQDVLCQCNINVPDNVSEVIFDHSRGAVADLLSRLEQGDEGSRPSLSVVRHQPRSPQQAGDVNIVSARVRHRNRLALRIRRHRGAGVR